MIRATCPSSPAARRAAPSRLVAGGSLVLLALGAPFAYAGGASCTTANAACAVHCAQANRANCTAAATATASSGASAAAAAATTPLPAPAAFAPRGEAELRAVRDPESGGWTLAPLWATAMPLEQIAARNFSSDGLVFETLPDGGVAVDLQGRFQSFSVARRALNGELESGCTDSPSSLFEWFYGLAPSTPPIARAER